jgi:alpha-ketoglutarate-dependent taurine dioxygenase
MSNAEHFQAFYVDISQKNAAQMIQTDLKKRGLVTFDQIHSVEELRLFCSKFGKTLMHRDSDKYGVTRIINREMMLPEDGYQAFTNAALTLHTDGSSIAEPATLVVFWCAHPGETGGLSLFVDGKRIYQFLAEHHPSILQTLVKPRSVIFAGAEAPLESAIFSKLPDGKIRIRFRYDSLGYYSAPVSSTLPLFLRLLEQHKIMFALQKHQGYIIQNGRWLHGRTAFSGGREAYRMLIQPSEQQIQPGFDLD